MSSIVSPVRNIPKRLLATVTPHNTPIDSALHVDCEDCGMMAPLDLPHECSPPRRASPVRDLPPDTAARFMGVIHPRPHSPVLLEKVASKR